MPFFYKLYIKTTENSMEPIEIMKRPAAYASGYENTPTEAQGRYAGKS